jgi:hypothetical protein
MCGMRKVTVVLVIGLGVLAGRACMRSAPEDRLASFNQNICRIAQKGADSPVRGVDRLLAHFAESTPDMMHDLAEMFVQIEAIGDDQEHDARARRARDRVFAPLDACWEDLEKFGEAVENDPEARHHWERGWERFMRSLGIFLGDERLRGYFDGRALVFKRWMK